MAIADIIQSMETNIDNAYTAIGTKGGTIPANKNLENLASAINSIQGGGGVSTQSQSIFTGWTAPLTYLNSTDNVFEYKSATHNITITGLNSIATISGNGTKNVSVTIDTTATSDRQTPFTITCVKDTQTLTYNGIAFHYGTDVTSGNCLAVAQTISNNQIAYIFIESSSLPTFTTDTELWNSVYSYQIISFVFAKSSVTNIGDNFLYNSYLFNQPLTIPNTVTSIGNYFLRTCYSFNQPLTIPSGVTSIGSYFLFSCCPFNQPLTIPNTVTSIGDYFLRICYSFNQPLTISNTITSIGDHFLYQCQSFNQPLTIPNTVTSIGSYFLYQCYVFNQPLTIPSGVTSIGSYFLDGCQSFNQPLTIPNTVTSIGDYFFSQNRAFNQPLTIPNTVTSIGSYFLFNCQSFIYLEYNASVYPTDNNSLSQNTNSKTSSYGTGILVIGTHASDLKNALPDRTASPYRKLVLAS